MSLKIDQSLETNYSRAPVDIDSFGFTSISPEEMTSNVALDALRSFTSTPPLKESATSCVCPDSLGSLNGAFDDLIQFEDSSVSKARPSCAPKLSNHQVKRGLDFVEENNHSVAKKDLDVRKKYKVNHSATIEKTNLERVKKRAFNSLK